MATFYLRNIYHTVTIRYFVAMANERHKSLTGNMRLRRDSKGVSQEIPRGDSQRGDTAPPGDAVRVPREGCCSCRARLVIGSEAKGVAGALTRSRGEGGRDE